MGFQAYGVELGGKGIEGAERGNVEHKAITPPRLAFKGALGWDGLYPFLGELRRPGAGLEKGQRKLRQSLGKLAPPSRGSGPFGMCQGGRGVSGNPHNIG